MSLILLVAIAGRGTASVVDGSGHSLATAQPSTSISYQDVSPLRLIENVSPYGQDSFDPKSLMLDISWMLPIVEYNGYVTVYWWGGQDNNHYYMSTAKNGKWILRDKQLDFHNVTGRILVWKNNLYFVGGAGISRIEVSLGTGSLSAPTAVSTKPVLKGYVQDGLSGPVQREQRSDGTWYLLNLTNGTTRDIQDNGNHFPYGFNESLYADPTHNMVFIPGHQGQSHALNILTGEDAKDGHGQTHSPEVGPNLIANGNAVYTVIPAGKADLSVRKFDYTLNPAGSVHVKVVPYVTTIPGIGLPVVNRVMLTLGNNEVHVWHMIQWQGRMALELIAVQ